MGGWDQMRGRLIGEAEDRPMIVCFDTCIHSIRTIPALQHDKDRIEDIDTDSEDHAADEWRYACMSRPWVKPVPVEKVIVPKGAVTVDQFIKMAETKHQKGARI